MKATILHKADAVLLLGSAVLGTAHAAHEDSHGPATIPDVTFTLTTDIANGQLVFVGAKGKIQGEINPQLQVAEGAVVQINLINGDGAMHDIAVPQFGADSDDITGKGASTAIVFRATKEGTFEYLCTLPGQDRKSVV